MKLADGLGINRGKAIAIVGAGGKTSTLFTLARELSNPVIVTTTTHLGVWQARLAQRHIILSEEKFKQSPEAIIDGLFLNDTEDKLAETVLLTGPEHENDRLSGLSAELLDVVYNHCLGKGISLLIEADGSRLKPLKAPADYEPVIPAWVDHVVVVAGLNGLGKPLGEAYVHRPDIFAHIAECQMGETILVDHLVRVLISPSGGVKDIPAGVGKSLFLNQAEGDVRMAQGARIAAELSHVYDRVVIGSLQQPNPQGPVFSVHSQPAGIILAAGGSDRLGHPKQLLDWWGKSFVVQVVENALTAGLTPLLVVTGSAHDLIEQALEGLDVKCIHNPHWLEGQSTSMKAGIAALPISCDRVVVLLSDQPQISPLMIRQLIERHNIHRAPITAPLIQEQRGNPVLFGWETFDALSAISGDQGGRAVFSKFKVDYVPWIDRRALLDVDIEADIEKLRNAYFSQV